MNQVKLAVYSIYIRAVGGLLSTLVILFCMGQIGLSMAANVWLAEWSSDMQMSTNDTWRSNSTLDTASIEDKRDMRLAVFASIGFMEGIVLSFI